MEIVSSGRLGLLPWVSSNSCRGRLGYDLTLRLDFGKLTMAEMLKWSDRILLLVFDLMVTVAYDHCTIFIVISSCSCSLVPKLSILSHFIISSHLRVGDPLLELAGVPEHRSFLECVYALR